jgi:hypothetical protein
MTFMIDALRIKYLTRSSVLFLYNTIHELVLDPEKIQLEFFLDHELIG